MRPINKLSAGGMSFRKEATQDSPASPAFGRTSSKTKHRQFRRLAMIPKTDIDSLLDGIVADVTLPGNPRKLVNGGAVHAKKLLHRRLVDLLGMNPKDIVEIVKEEDYVPFLRELLDQRIQQAIASCDAR